jgi:hypothetical protein
MNYSAIEFYSGISHGFGYEYAKVVCSDGTKLEISKKKALKILKKMPSLTISYFMGQ